MKKTMTLFLILLTLTAYSQEQSKDSIEYPLTGHDIYGTQIVTITRKQQEKVTEAFLELSKCKNIVISQDGYIWELEQQLTDFQIVIQQQDSLNKINSLVIKQKETVIDALETKVDLHLDQIHHLEQDNKKRKNKLLAWKIGTFTTIGVTLVAIPVTIAVLSNK